MRVTGFIIGYGDIVMKTPAGQALAIVIGLTGIIFTGVIVEKRPTRSASSLSAISEVEPSNLSQIRNVE